MKLKMAQNSVFAILLRSAWWISALIALAIVALSAALLPAQYAWAGAFGALPFFVIAGIALVRQLKAPSSRRIEQVHEAVAAMSWPVFADALHAAFERDGCQVQRCAQGPADFALRRGQHLALVGARRWKAQRVGVQALRELAQAAQAQQARECLYVALGEVSEPAARFAREQGIQLLDAAQLARLLPRQ
ncbi:restriction endonuclease [Orrella sp. JC864]|uniref:restriction endonuclease n=1 Tax=Orrella sp. JC864 TaxID=3120298 RepID=UPI0012BCA48B